MRSSEESDEVFSLFEEILLTDPFSLPMVLALILSL